MTDLISFQQQLAEHFPDQQQSTVEEFEGRLVVNSKIALPILVSHCFNKEASINVYNDDNITLGTLYFLKNKVFEIGSLPEEIYIAFLDENRDRLLQTEEYTFLSDYLIIEEPNILEYFIEYKLTSALWGGFFHLDDLPSVHFGKSNSITEIYAHKRLFLDMDVYKESLAIALKETNPFNRFLKYYQLLELHFDMHTADKLKKLVELGQKEKEISKTLKDYSREDMERIKSLFKDRVVPNRLVPYLNKIKDYLPIASSMFYDFGKESNPIKSISDFREISSRGFSEQNVTKYLNGSSFQIKIPQIAAYWIYRIRSSIAHNKLGEYLMTSADEEFIVEFAEPLVKELVIQSYTKPTLN